MLVVKFTSDKTKSDIRYVERYFVLEELKLEEIACESFDDFYCLEKRHQSMLLEFLNLI